MRTRLIQSLSYPRFLLRDLMDLEECEHDGMFDAGSAECERCLQKTECRWLMSNDEFAALSEKPLKELLRAVEYALGYVDSHVAFWEHNARVCACDSCRWVRTTQSLVEEARAALGVSTASGG